MALEVTVMGLDTPENDIREVNEHSIAISAVPFMGEISCFEPLPFSLARRSTCTTFQNKRLGPLS